MGYRRPGISSTFRGSTLPLLIATNLIFASEQKTNHRSTFVKSKIWNPGYVAFTFSRQHLILSTHSSKRRTHLLSAVTSEGWYRVDWRENPRKSCAIHTWCSVISPCCADLAAITVHYFVTLSYGIETLLMRLCASGVHHCGVHLQYIKSEPIHRIFPSHPLCHEGSTPQRCLGTDINYSTPDTPRRRHHQFFCKLLAMIPIPI
jgi:hypothetical protein